MTTQIQNDYKALHAAAITLGTRMLAAMPDEQLEAMERMTKSGAKLMFEIELPNCTPKKRNFRYGAGMY